MKFKVGDEIMIQATWGNYQYVNGMTGIITKVYSGWADSFHNNEIPDSNGKKKILYSFRSSEGKVYVNVVGSVLVLFNPSVRYKRGFNPSERFNNESKQKR